MKVDGSLGIVVLLDLKKTFRLDNIFVTLVVISHVFLTNSTLFVSIPTEQSVMVFPRALCLVLLLSEAQLHECREAGSTLSVRSKT